jgi:hypothetical protein
MRPRPKIQRTYDAIFRLVLILAALECGLEIVHHVLAVVRVAHRAQQLDRHGLPAGRKPENTEELRGGADQPSRHVDVPHADAGRVLGQAQNLVALA